MTDVIQLLSLLDSVLGSNRPQGRAEYLFPCSFCSHHKPKLAVNLETGKWHCWVCERGGHSLIGLLKQTNAPNQIIKRLAELLKSPIKFEEHKEEKILTLPIEFKPLWKPQKDFEHKHAIAFLGRRGLERCDILKYQIGYCLEGDYAHRVIFPSYDLEGRLNYFTGRSYIDSEFTYKNPSYRKNIVGFESLVSWEFPIIICEGPLDAIAIRRNSIPLFGKSVSQKLRETILLEKVKDIYLALDPDALRNSLTIAKDFMHQNINVYIIDLEGKDPSELGFRRMSEKIRNTKNPLTFSGLVKMRVGLI
jgi:DNA primase